jgi:hypothetical protein
MKQNVALEDKKKNNIRIQINGKFNDINSADENKYEKNHCRAFI